MGTGEVKIDGPDIHNIAEEDDAPLGAFDVDNAALLNTRDRPRHPQSGVTIETPDRQIAGRRRSLLAAGEASGKTQYVSGHG